MKPQDADLQAVSEEIEQLTPAHKSSQLEVDPIIETDLTGV